MTLLDKQHEVIAGVILVGIAKSVFELHVSHHITETSPYKSDPRFPPNI